MEAFDLLNDGEVVRQEAAEEGECFQEILDSSFHWEYLVEASGGLRYISPACETIAGYSPTDFQQNPALLDAIVYPADRVIVTDHLQERVDLVSEVSLQFRILTKGGEVRWILHRCRPLFDERGEYLGRRATNQDITLRKRAESERMEAEKQLKALTQQLITIQEAERKRIAQDLHDDLGQGMTALLLRLNAILNNASPGMEESLLDAIRSAESLTGQVRQLARQLYPPPLDAVPLPKALESLCSSFSQHAKLYVDLSSDHDLPPISNLQGTVLFRLAQEGLNNIVKYSKATAVWINLDYMEGEVGLSLEDNGQGFDLNGVEKGLGLRSLEERFRLLNGRFEVESTPGVGTRICGFLPLADHNL
jgi:two-component system sensor histidine kinase UhpB